MDEDKEKYQEILKKSLKKLSKCQIIDLIDIWNHSTDEFSRKVPNLKENDKNAIINYLVYDHFTEKNIINDREYAQLDMKYARIQTKNHKRLWSVYTSKFAENKEYSDALDNASEFISYFQINLNLFFVHNTYYEQENDKIFVRISIFDATRSSRYTLIPPPSNVIYIIFIQKSNLLLISQIKKEYEDYFIQILIDSLHAHKLHKLNLTAKNIESIKDFVLNSNSQGPYKSYQLNKVDVNPLSSQFQSKKKRKAENGDMNIIIEDEQERKELDELVEEIFGNEEQPILETVDFNIVTDNVKVSNDLEMKVKFSGSSVIEGLKCLTEKGIAVPPLPIFISNLHSSSANSFTIKLDVISDSDDDDDDNSK